MQIKSHQIKTEYLKSTVVSGSAGAGAVVLDAQAEQGQQSIDVGVADRTRKIG
jgi:hypothetical protein